MAEQANNPFDAQPPKPQNQLQPAAAPAQLTSAPAPGLVNGQMQATTYTPQTRQVDASKGTVQGQVNSILTQDGPLMQRARSLALEQMNGRGLVNSSMAIEAAQGAMMDRALPMASQDAGTYDTAGRDNQSAVNNAGQFNAGQTNQVGVAGAQLQHDTTQQQAQRDFTAQQNTQAQKAQADLSTQAQKSQAELQATQGDQQMKALTQQHANTLEQMGYQNNLAKANVPAQYAQQVSMATMDRVNAIMADPNLDPVAKKNAVDNVVNYANSTLGWAEKFYATPLSKLSAPATPGLPAGFDENAYLQANPDVAAVVATGQTTAAQHYLMYGQKEGRRLSPGGAAGAPAAPGQPPATPATGIIGAAASLPRRTYQPTTGGIA